MAPTRAEIEEAQKRQWLGEHLPYELMMVRYSIEQLRDPVTFWLDWNAYHASFAVSACNLAAFLTNKEGGNNFRAHDFVTGFRSRKEDLAKTFERLEPQVFHLGKARPSDQGKFTLKDAEDVSQWIETEIAKFIGELRDLGQYWNAERAKSEVRPKGPPLRLTGLEPQTASSADPKILSVNFVTGPNASAMAEAERKLREPGNPDEKA
jgi:hypothetical protein